MSGGSFGYLHSADLCDRSDDLREMASALQELGFYELAKETRDLIPQPSKGLREVWRAVEWWRSCDTSVREAVRAGEKYEAEKLRESNPPG